MTAADLARAVNGVRNGNGWLCRCPLPDHGQGRGDFHPSLSIRDGDDGRLLVRCFADCDPLAVLAELRRLGLDDGQRENSRHPATRSRSPHSAKPDRNLARRVARARKTWFSAIPIDGTLAESYLRERELRRPFPPTLKFHPSLDYFERAAAGAQVSLPALVAGVATWPSHRVEAVQVTYLDPRGTGKAQVSTPRKSFGRCCGGAVRLAAAADRLFIGEGVETVLAAMQATGSPGWATLGTSGLRSLILPDAVRDVVIAADGDSPGIEAAEAAAERWIAEGRTVRIARPPDGHDFADVLAGKCPAGIEDGDAA